jgi:hypothetical protein
MGVILILVCISGCGRGRPDPETWRARWSRARAAFPQAAAFETGDPQSACDALLVEARRWRSRLLPSPDAALDPAVRTWIDRAEAIGYECPAAREGIAAHRAALNELRTVEAEIEAGLAAGSPS